MIHAQNRSRPSALAILGLLAILGAAAPDASSDTATEGAPQPVGVHGTAPGPVAGTPSVVVLRPSSLAPPSPDRQTATIDQLGLVFTPTELMAMVGERVLFTNSETIAHNVHLRFTDTDSTVLNVDTDPAGRAEFAVFAQRDGTFQLADVPPGEYTLSVWSIDPRFRSEQTLTVSGTSTEVMIPGM
jgi:plastocyanin